MPKVGVREIQKRTRAERRAARESLNLRDAGITMRTRAAYVVALGLLMPFIESVANEAELDIACADG